LKKLEANMNSSTYTITLLADKPELVNKWAKLQWQEWGNEPGREELDWWIHEASKAINRLRVPVAFIAFDSHDEVLGGVGLSQFDLEERQEQSPWVVGTIVRADRRNEGIGQTLMAHLERWAINTGITQIWVATGGRAIAFYQKCGFEWIEEFSLQQGEIATILRKALITPDQIG
jgi:GNAT superfamily N-acetyltransferase